MPRRPPSSSSSDSDDTSDSDDSSYESGSEESSTCDGSSNSSECEDEEEEEEEDSDDSDDSSSSSSSRSALPRRRSVFFADEAEPSSPTTAQMDVSPSRRSSRVGTPPRADKPRRDHTGRVVAPSRHLTALPRSHPAHPSHNAPPAVRTRPMLDDPAFLSNFLERNVDAALQRRQLAIQRHQAAELAAANAAAIRTTAPKLTRRRQRKLMRRLIRDDLKVREKRLKQLDRTVHPPLKKVRLTKKQMRASQARLVVPIIAHDPQATAAAAAAIDAEMRERGRDMLRLPRVKGARQRTDPPSVVGEGSPHARDRAVAEGGLPAIQKGRRKMV